MSERSTLSPRRLGAWLLALAPLLLGALILFKTLDFLFVWDDELLLSHPLRSSAAADFLAALRDSLTGFVINPQIYWRPLGSLSFWAPSAWCKTDACLIESAHLINYAIYLAHLAATLILAKVMLARRQERPMASSSQRSLLFCVVAACAAVGLHPANAEIFAWISGRFDAMLSLFLTLALALSWARKGSLAIRLMGLFALFSLAQLSKDGAQAGCSLIALLALASPKPMKEKWAIAAACALSLLLIGALRASWAGAVNPEGFLVELDLATLIPRYASGSGQAFLSLVQPWIGVSPAHPIVLGAKEIIASLLFHLVFVGSLWGAARAWAKKRPSLAAWAMSASTCALILMSCAINSALRLNQDFIWADRYLAPAWPFFAAAIALGLYEARVALGARAAALRAPAILVSAVLIGASALALHQETSFWRDNVFFWNRVVQEDPDNIKSVTNYTLALYQAGRLDLAEREAERGLAIMGKTRNGFYEMIRMASAVKLALGKNYEAKEIIAAWQRAGFDAFDLRVQQAIIGYSEKDCAAGDAARSKAIELSKDLPAYKTLRELPLMESLSAQCHKTQAN